MTSNPTPPPKPAETRRDTLIWIVPTTLIAFIYWSVANYVASVEYAGQVPDNVRNGQYAVMTFILGFIGFIIAFKRRTFAENKGERAGNWGLVFGGIVTAFFWILSMWFFMNSSSA